MTPDEELLGILLQTYRGKEYEVWEIPLQDEPVNLEKIIGGLPADQLHEGGLYLAAAKNPNVVDIVSREKMRVTFPYYSILADAFEITPKGVRVDDAEPNPNRFTVINHNGGIVLINLRSRKTHELSYGEFIDAVERLSGIGLASAYKPQKYPILMPPEQTFSLN